ncbi:MAG TPA: Nramp family divalent metal transporter [Candidatus Glassbacteria bacterium]|nr:Nramp family divalent metal transporter [Candidatus Glassbacteria bacterium]
MIETVRKIARSLGPGLIVAAVVLGPGSITSISATGSILGNRMLWIVLLSGVFMLTYTVLMAKFGAISRDSFLTVVARRYGRWLAALIGVCAFLVCAGFQWGNNLGVGMAMNAIVGGPTWLWALVFTLIAIGFLFFFRNLYAAIEKLMMTLVVLMIVAFVSNLAVAGPDPVKVAAGFIPKRFDPQFVPMIAAIVATSFSVMAALFQSYLVQEKNWGREQIGQGIRDSVVGIAALTLISAVVMVTSATVLNSRGIQVRSAADMAAQLEPLLGRAAMWLFCLGLWGASFSSFLGNAVLGGTLLSDGFGIGGRMDSRPAKCIAVAIMLIGMTVAAASSKFSPVNTIIVAQAVTVIAVPLACFMIFWLSNRRDLMGEEIPRWWVNLLALGGLVTVCLLSANTLKNLLGKL